MPIGGKKGGLLLPKPRKAGGLKRRGREIGHYSISEKEKNALLYCDKQRGGGRVMSRGQPREEEKKVKSSRGEGTLPAGKGKRGLHIRG